MVGALKAEGELALALEVHLAFVFKADHFSVRHIVEVGAGGLHPFIPAQLLEEVSPDIEFRLVARNEVGKVLFLFQQGFRRFPIPGFFRQVLPVIPGPDTGRQVEIPISELNWIRADGIVDQVKIRYIILAGVHDAHLGLAAVGVVVVLGKVADQVVRVVTDLHIKALKLQNVINQVLGLIKVVAHAAVVQLYGLQAVTLLIHLVLDIISLFWRICKHFPHIDREDNRYYNGKKKEFSADAV